MALSAGDAVRVLLLADTHIGFDTPRRPRVERRRRGPDFLRCFHEALGPARRGDVDLVVHGGDLLYRRRVPASLVAEAVAPLRAVADLGVPVFLVPGNHERGEVPFPLLALHPLLFVFTEPRTVAVEVRGRRVAVSGFPFRRRPDLPALLDAAGAGAAGADVRLLCMHQVVEGARVEGFVFRRGPDVIARRRFPAGFDAVFSGHIHRWQALTRRLPAPVLYPGSVERTSFQERFEEKGFLLVDVAPGRVTWTFRPLPARPMRVVRSIGALAACPADAVVRVDAPIGAAALRALAPPTMTIHAGRPRLA